METVAESIILCVMGLIAVVVGGLIILMGVTAYQQATAETFELRKDQFACTRSREVTDVTLLPVRVGNVTTSIPTTSSATVCDQWSRK